MYDPMLTQKISHIVHQLPPMPSAIDRLLDLMGDIKHNEKEIRAMIKTDPSLCTETLYLANSDCYLAAGTIETLDDAIRIVGLEPLVQLVCVSYADKAIKTEFAAIEHVEQYFQHSRQISLGCRILAEVCKLSAHQRQMYAVAGLIHDIGRLVILLATNTTKAAFLGTSPEELLSVLHDEHELVGTNHCDIGEQICRNWNFTPTLCEGVLRHHTPIVTGSLSEAGTMIFLAHFVTTSDFTGKILSRMTPLEALMDNLKLSEKDFDAAAHRYSAMTKSIC
jgi:HD-like signal output (HDOD) protein